MDYKRITILIRRALKDTKYVAKTARGQHPFEIDLRGMSMDEFQGLYLYYLENRHHYSKLRRNGTSPLSFNRFAGVAIDYYNFDGIAHTELQKKSKQVWSKKHYEETKCLNN